MTSMTSTPSDSHSPPFGAEPRPLAEDVLQSAEEAVVANPSSADTLQGAVPAAQAASRAARSTPASDRLARLVAEKPAQSALLAMVAGALLAAIIKQGLRRRRRP